MPDIARAPFEVQVCGALMVGSGTDSYDPLCELPHMHSGPCRSTAAIDQHRIDCTRTRITETP